MAQKLAAIADTGKTLTDSFSRLEASNKLNQVYHITAGELSDSMLHCPG